MIRRIAVISDHASPLATLGGVDSGGQNVYVGQVSKHLAALGYQVDIFTRRDDEGLPEIVKWAGDCGARIVHVSAGPPTFVRKEDVLPYMDDFRDWILSFCQREGRGYDLIHANFWMSGLVAADLKRILGTPFVITFHALGRVRRLHQGGADEFPDVRFAIEDRLVAEADAIIAECPQDEEDLRQLYHADPQRITIVPCGFDPEELGPIDRQAARARLGLPADERIILQLGRMVPRKGVDTVVRGLAHLLKDHHIPALLVVVGGESEETDPALTPEIGRLQAIAQEEGVAEHVTFTGRRRRDVLKYYYSAADVFVTTPWYEPFGITPVESMACGTPVVGAQVGGIKYTVVDGVTGFLVPPRDPEALAQRLAQLFKNPDLLAVFGEQAIARANQLFTWSTVAKSIAALYEQVLAAQQPEKALETDRLAIVDAGFDTLLKSIRQSQRRLRPSILMAAQALTACFARGNKVMVAGNGGSAADAQHLVGELVGRFVTPYRPALPALALTADSAVLTAWANDAGYDQVFARQVEAYGRPGDVLIGISTSGKSPNLIQAFAVARQRGLQCMALLGKDGGELLGLSDLAIVVPSFNTQRIQEIHTFILHLLCELVEQDLALGQPLEIWAQAMWGANENGNGNGHNGKDQITNLKYQMTKE